MPKASTSTAGYAPLSASDFLTLDPFSGAELESLMATGERCRRTPERFAGALAGRACVMLFEKPSLRTRCTFELGAARLGMHALYYDHGSERIGARESVKDYAKNIERWADLIVARVYEHATLEGLAQHARVPVINALSNDHHPCQALADVMTIAQRLGRVRGVRVCFVGDGNNVCQSLAQACAKLGAHTTIITPRGHGMSASVSTACERWARESGGSLRLSNNPSDVEGQQAVYTDTWVSMHHREGDASRLKAFAPFQVNEKLMRRAAPDAIFMHCLPAHRGQEVTDGVIDATSSAVYDQAENRMHAQMALMLHLLLPKHLTRVKAGGTGRGTSRTKTKKPSRRRSAS